MNVWLHRLVFVLVCLTVQHTAHAQMAVLIVIQRSNSSELSACEQRLRSELSAEGYQPTTVQVSSDPNAAVLVETTKRLTSPAAISIAIHEGIVSGLVWMVDPKKAGGLLRAVTDYPMGEQTAAVFAVSATDVLHGGLLELGYIQDDPKPAPAQSPSTILETKPLPPKPRPTPPAHVVAIPTPLPTSEKIKNRQRKHDWQLSITIESIVALANTPVALAPNLTFTRRLGTNFGLGLSGRLTLPVTLEGERGNADLNQFMGGAWLEYRQFVGTHLTVFEFFETGVHYASVRGRAREPLTNYDSYAYTVYHHAGAGLNWNATADFGIGARAGFLLPWRPSKVVIVDETVTKVATPAIILGVGMAIKF